MCMYYVRVCVCVTAFVPVCLCSLPGVDLSTSSSNAVSFSLSVGHSGMVERESSTTMSFTLRDRNPGAWVGGWLWWWWWWWWDVVEKGRC